MKKSELRQMIREELAKANSEQLTEAKVIKTQSVHKALEPARKLAIEYISQLDDPKAVQDLRNAFSDIAGLISDARMELGSRGISV